MKIRNGFVSNSSSSSFLLYGAEIYIDNKSDDYYNDYERIDEILSDIKYTKNGLKYSVEDIREEGETYVGVSPENFPDDMVVGNIKKQIKSDLIEIFGKDNVKHIGWHEDCSYNG